MRNNVPKTRLLMTVLRMDEMPITQYALVSTHHRHNGLEMSDRTDGVELSGSLGPVSRIEQVSYRRTRGLARCPGVALEPWVLQAWAL